jgi:hypothetical protein
MGERVSSAVKTVIKPDRARTRQYERFFFSGMAILILATVFLGFAKTYFLAGVFSAPLPSWIIHVHGAVFTSWILLLIVQTLLVSAGHFKLLADGIWRKDSLSLYLKSMSRRDLERPEDPRNPFCEARHEIPEPFHVRFPPLLVEGKVPNHKKLDLA